ncbi:MAG: clostripain-related cysteine peptidase [Terracidiphilus sp.]
MSDTQDYDAGAVPPPKTWGIYVYFAADVRNSAMQASVWSTLQTIALVGSKETVKITAMVDLPGRNTEYYIIPPRPKTPAEAQARILPDRFLSNVNSASIDTIMDFFDWSHRNCPADNIALIFWGHGYALDDFDPRIQQKIGGIAPTSADGIMGRVASTFPAGRPGELKLLYDATHNSVLSNRDFSQAIRNYCEFFNQRRPIQILGLDCCNMAMVEVLTEFQGSTEYAVAAETALPFQAWLSAPVLQKFLDGPMLTARQFAITAVQDFVDYMASSATLFIELSACNMECFGRLETAMRELVKALLPAIEISENRRAVAHAWERDVSFLPDGMIDLASFCELLASYINPAEADVKTAALSVRDAVQGFPKTDGSCTGGVVDYKGIAPRFTGRRIERAKGLSIWFPPWIQFPHVRYFQMRQSKDYLFGGPDGYSSTRFAKVTGWDRFLLKLFFLTQGQIGYSGG